MSVPKVASPSSRQPRDHHLGLLPDADQRGVDVVDVDLRLGLGLHRLDGQLGEALGTDADDDVGQQLGVVRLQTDRTGVTGGLGDQPVIEDVRDLLVRAVLEQPREKQVARLQQGQVRLVLDLGGRQQAGRLEVQQGRRDDEELGGLVEVPVRPHGADIGHELVGDLGQGDLGDVQLVLGDQLEEEVEGPLEVVQPHGEPIAAVLGLRLATLRLTPAGPATGVTPAARLDPVTRVAPGPGPGPGRVATVPAPGGRPIEVGPRMHRLRLAPRHGLLFRDGGHGDHRGRDGGLGDHRDRGSGLGDRRGRLGLGVRRGASLRYRLMCPGLRVRRGASLTSPLRLPQARPPAQRCPAPPRVPQARRTAQQ
ncbi:hypothetical protein SANTM175S_03578 [Streptomyces antimycoticus]